MHGAWCLGTATRVRECVELDD